MNKNFIKALILFCLILFGMTDVKALTLEPYINESSTYKVVIEDKVFDGSIKNKLEFMKLSLKQGGKK